MSGLFIGVKRIIAVDSSDFAYAELDIDKHCMLVAEGNVGKSSLINAIRLFFLPECSMAKQAINFGFSDSQGEHYSSEASFQHYFPSKYSFLILEYEKRLFDGEHSCQILSMAAGRLKFERMFTSLPYEQIRHLFWEEGDDADGIGKRVDGLSKQSVYAFIQAQDKHAVLAKEASKVASLIYESELAATRFTLFPLNNIDEQQVNSLRALIKLLFVASSRNKKPFTSAIAHIIESGKKHSQDQLGFSIAEFKAKHESLKTEENKLNAITNWQGKFDKLRKHKKDFLDYLAILGQVEPAKAWLLATLDIKIEKAKAQISVLERAMIEQSAQQLQSLQNTIQNGLRDYIEARVISDKHGLKGDSPFWHEIAACFNDVEEVYGNLEMQRHLLGKQIEEHNQTIGNKREVIIQNYRLIKSFEHEINEAFAGITINNIEKVEFTVGINRQFDSLVKEFEHTNLFAQEMQSDAFYTRLVAFAERFFDEDDNFVLSMDKVIESFEPKVKVRNKTSTEDKKQSNSTNALIKIKLVQLLLNRLIAHKTQTAFPIVHDEIANIDIGQFDWWLQDLSAAGFSLVAAGTHSTSPELQAKIGRRHVLDAMTSAQAYHQERNRVYWQGAEEFVSVAEPQIQADLV